MLRDSDKIKIGKTVRRNEFTEISEFVGTKVHKPKNKYSRKGKKKFNFSNELNDW